MGYESRLYIVQKYEHGISDDNGKVYGEVIAMFNVCTFYELSNVLRDQPATNCYIFDGYKNITKDLYGEPLTESSLPLVINTLEQILTSGEDYRRIYPLLSMLKTFEEQKNRWGNLIVLHYGY